jgi:hypothetical protein
MPDLGDLGDLVEQAKDLVDDHAKEIKQGINQLADVVDDQVSKDQRGTVHDVADAAKGLVDEVAGDSAKPKKDSAKPKKKVAKKQA